MTCSQCGAAMSEGFLGEGQYFCSDACLHKVYEPGTAGVGSAVMTVQDAVKCDHANYDEYFEQCTDCGADVQHVLRDELRTLLEQRYADFAGAGFRRSCLTERSKARFDTAIYALAEVFDTTRTAQEEAA